MTRPRNKKPRYGKDSNFKGKPGRSGPPKGNRNALRHGLTCGKAANSTVEKWRNKFRQKLENLVLETKGVISKADVATIFTACTAFESRMNAVHYMRRLGKRITLEQFRYLDETITKRTRQIEEAIITLDLDGAASPDRLTLDAYLEGQS